MMFSLLADVSAHDVLPGFTDEIMAAAFLVIVGLAAWYILRGEKPENVGSTSASSSPQNPAKEDQP